MNLKYAVVSSNTNPGYLDFWPYVARAWKNLIGLEPVLLYIDDNPPSPSLSEHGLVFHLDPIPNWSIIQQSQSIRFWAARILDAPFIISDIDMLPISKDYYLQGVSGIGENQIVSYSSDVIKYRWYRTNPQYPMCYLAGSPDTFSMLLDIKEDDHKQFLNRLANLGIRAGTDQKFFYDQSKLSPETLVHLERGWIEEKYATRRLDKAIWPKFDYNPAEYIDCHLPRPLSQNKEICKILFDKLNLV